MATLGYGGSFTSWSQHGAAPVQGASGPYTMTETGKVTNISIYGGPASGTAAGRVAVWDAGSGAILTQGTVTFGAVGTGTNGQAWQTFAVPGVFILAGQQILIGFWEPGSVSWNYSIQTGVGSYYTKNPGAITDMASASVQSSFRSGSYITYTPGLPSGVKTWTGAGYAKHPVRTWTGAGWAWHPVKTWTGAGWATR